MEENTTEHVIMTPKKKTSQKTTLMIQRQKVLKPIGEDSKVHIAGGDHQGIIINKEMASDADDSVPAQVSLEFRVFLVSAHTGKHTQESRQLLFWFQPDSKENENAAVAQQFFRELVSPQEFPRDYVGFIKKIMKLMQHKYKSIKKLEVELNQLDETLDPPTRPLSTDETALGKIVPLTEDKVLEMIESSYPNPITGGDIARENCWAEADVEPILAELLSKGLIKSLDHGAFTRVVRDDSDVQIVKQMPTIASSKQPTIAIVTAQYCEKLAVDAMIENKETFVRYTTVGPSVTTRTSGIRYRPTRFGESNVYTLGNIGAHRIVCTKLPTVGHTREAMTAAGNTTTRLLGTFQKVDFVFLVGVGGGVPHFTDYNRHVRLGDVVVSHATDDGGYIYVYCEGAKQKEDGVYEFETKKWKPANPVLQEIATKLKTQSEVADPSPAWMPYLKDGLSLLQSSESEHDFQMPPVESDKLYMPIGAREVIEVAHPAPGSGDLIRQHGSPRVHMGPIAAGRCISRDEQMRQAFAAETGALAFDSEFDAVVESILGNCRESFVVVRGVADYRDGSRRGEWQPYAALAAASVAKAIICGMDPPSDT
ncbi:uncharacterized protein LOC124160620 isoform X2 [Ischnura elegans]|uniref:uncharacterized protein LOC124160620 isoform X2 n=1 Tax=Ischnura elegans TaxID=197161 RepID=UPI001ED8AA4B|nr:uncharacterized protein LOC124160620 isoform X2 [Ischnura elegans]